MIRPYQPTEPPANRTIGVTKQESDAAGLGSELCCLLRQYRWPVLLTYLLFNLENLLRLAQPLLLGWAINDLLQSSHVGLICFAVGHLSFMSIRTLRQLYDTRVFTAMHAQRAAALILRQRRQGIDVSRVAARSALSQEFVNFLERHVPTMIGALYSVVGALVMLVWFDWVVAGFCLAMAVPAAVLNLNYSRRALHLSGLLHNRLEREVHVVQEADSNEVRIHFQQVARWRIKLSDWEALTTGIMEFFVMALMAGALLRYCTLESVTAGSIFAVFRYVLMFIMALDTLPLVVQQISRLRDIGTRMDGPTQ